MTNVSSPLEVTGSTVDDAIATGLKQLNLTRDAVDVEILDEGSKGLFGLGARDASVRLTPHTPAPAVSPPPTSSPTPQVPAPAEVPVSQEAPAPTDEEDLAFNTDEETMEDMANLLDEEDEVLGVARGTVTDLLDKMHIPAEITATYQETDDERRQRPSVLVEINGDDLSILIGRQAETLNALQYITRLIVSKELNRGVDLELDVQGYRARRHEQLRRLARQMADQAVRTGKRQFLEPMAADDRRIIHIALRNHPQVFTESQGEGSRRKVTINPK